MASGSEKKQIEDGFDRILKNSAGLISHIEKYSTYSTVPEVQFLSQKYVSGLNRHIRWWTRYHEQYKKRGQENAGDFSYQALSTKTTLGINRISYVYDEFENELEGLGLSSDYQSFLLRLYLKESTKTNSISIQTWPEIKRLEEEQRKNLASLYRGIFNNQNTAEINAECARVQCEINLLKGIKNTDTHI